ncbi:MAG: sigma factor-like helix-turn-helix DNA-binding protein [Chlorobiaceae bacterium]
MDDIYSLAYWMTGSLIATNELVSRTYRHAEPDSSQREFFRVFRSCYFESISPTAPTAPEAGKVPHRKSADIKLSVLLSEIVGLKHREISEIIGKPLETVRLWLSEGRKSLVEGTLLNASC